MASLGGESLPETVSTFWRQIWETDSRAIVMVTGLIEKGTQKCAALAQAAVQP